jgi:hypothetical protein
MRPRLNKIKKISKNNNIYKGKITILFRIMQEEIIKLKYNPLENLNKYYKSFKYGIKINVKK